MEVEAAKRYVEKWGWESFLYWNSLFDYIRNERIVNKEERRRLQHEETIRRLTEETIKLENEMKQLQIEKMRTDIESEKPKWFPWI